MEDNAAAKRDVTISLADPGPLGLFSFGYATFLANLSALGLFGESVMLIGTTIFLGGFGQLITGLISFKKQNMFGATIFTLFGLFWITSGVENILVALKVITPAGPLAMGWYLFTWTIFVLVMLIASLRSEKKLIVTLVFVELLLLFNTLATWTGIAALGYVGATSGIISSIIAFYMAAATLINSTFAKEVLP